VPGRHPIRSVFELAATRAARVVVPGLPRSAVVRMAHALGRAAAATPSHVRRVALANLRLAFGDGMTAAERQATVRTSFQSFALALLDVLWFSRNPFERLARHVRWDPAVLDLLRAPGPQVLLTGHVGNWETLGQSLAATGVPLMSVAAPLANPAVDRLLLEMRRASGQVIVAQRGAVLRLIRHLRAGGKVAMLLDQNVKPEEGGVFVPFFGLPVPVSAAAAALALRLRCPLRSAHLLADEAGDYQVVGFLSLEPVDASAPGAVETLTARLTAHCESVVRSHPGHWLWSYKRWKHVPPGEDPRRFPFYAKPYVPPALHRTPIRDASPV